MKRLLLTFILISSFSLVFAQTLSSLKWDKVCAGKMPAAWYGSDEAKSVADRVIYLQKESGGWDKNLEIHTMSQSDLDKAKTNPEHGKQSCFDNKATTQEMRFLAKVYHKTNVQEYKAAFNKALQLIFIAEKSRGGWSQYWPLTNDNKYQDYITFNDDLTINVMNILRDIYGNSGDFAGITDEAARERCKVEFDKSIDMILRCQFDDNGTLSAWGAQHDTVDFLPTEGRPHELPSISGCESASILTLLMSLENPSDEVKHAVVSAVEWLDAHKYLDGKAVEDFKNSAGEADVRIIDKANSALWARFIQIGGESGKQVYEKFFKKLKDRNTTRKDPSGKYSYKEHEMAMASYDENKAYQPIYSIYDSGQQHLYYRFLYNFNDTDPMVDEKGCSIATSLNAKRRSSYDFLGNWCYKVINTDYPAWKKKYGITTSIDDNYNDDDNDNDNQIENTYTIDGRVAGAGANGMLVRKGKIIFRSSRQY